MAPPLARPEQIAFVGAGPLLAVERRDTAGRDTACHVHAAGQLLGSAEGLVSVATCQRRFVAPATHAVWLPPRCEHALRSHGPFSGWSVYVAENACTTLPSRPYILRMSALLRAGVSRAAGWGDAPRTPPELRLAGVIMDEIAGLPEEPLGLTMPRDARLHRIADAFLADPSNARGQAAWAAWAAVPSRTLSRRFKAETGFSLTEWRQRARALRALEHLARGEAVTNVAINLGYDNVSAFIAMFRRTMGVTPGRYSDKYDSDLR